MGLSLFGSPPYTGDVTGITFDDADRQGLARARMVAAFARAAAVIAWEGSLQVVLDRLAEEVLIASSARACALVLVSRFGQTVDLYGSAGYPDGYIERFNEAMALRPPLVSLEAYRSRVQITRDMASALRNDPRLAPYADAARQAGWTTIVSIPLSVREERVGVLTALFSAENEPDESDIAFLTAMADHGANAIHTARLLAKSEKKAALEERNRMARDIHDAVSQSLFSMRLRTKALQIAAERTDDPTGRLRSGLRELEAVVDRAVDDMRALVLQLRPPDLEDSSLAEAIKRYAEAVCDRDALLVEIRVSGEVPNLPHDAEMEVYQIAREAIGNAVDHASASQVVIALGPVWRNGVAYLHLGVSDDGVGFHPDVALPGHLGISGMRSRAHELGAELKVESGSDGTRIQLDVPVSTATTEPEG